MPENQVNSFFIKRAKLSEGIADTHVKGGEFIKATKLYKEAYTFFLKAKKNFPEDAELSQNLEEIKQKYQKAKKNAENT